MKKSNGYTTQAYHAAERANYRRTLIVEWVFQNRKDIYDIADMEAYKKFPLQHIGRGCKPNLPKAMQDIKE